MNLSCIPGTSRRSRVNMTIRSATMTEIQGANSHLTGNVRARIRAAVLAVDSQRWMTPAAIGVLLSVGFAWTTVQVVVGGPLVAWDWEIREWVYDRRAQGAYAQFLAVHAFITGERWVTVPIVMGTAAYVAYRQGRLRPLYAVISGLAVIAAIGYPVKFGLGRSGPQAGFDLLHAGGQAFPSGHAANTAFTVTMVVFLLYGSAGARPDRRLFRRGVVVIALLLAESGTFVLLMGFHWLSDIPCGWLMGFIAVCVSLTVLHWPRRHEPRPVPVAVGTVRTGDVHSRADGLPGLTYRGLATDGGREEDLESVRHRPAQRRQEQTPGRQVTGRLHRQVHPPRHDRHAGHRG